MEKSFISIQNHFSALEDPRISLKTSHKLINIIVIAICGVICGADTWTQIEEFGKARLQWFQGFLELENGIPSRLRIEFFKNSIKSIYYILRDTTIMDCA